MGILDKLLGKKKETEEDEETEEVKERLKALGYLE